MAGIHHRLIYGGANSFTTTFPPGGASDITVIHGTATIDGSGKLVVQNTDVFDSAFAYFNSIPSTITDFNEQMDSQIPAGGAMGLLGAASFTGSTQNNGYRFDILADRLRLFRYDATVITSIAADVFTSGYYTIAGNDAILHFTRVGNVLDAWLSAPSQADSAHISATDGTYATGRIGMLAFSLGVGLEIDGYSATWSL